MHLQSNENESRSNTSDTRRQDLTGGVVSQEPTENPLTFLKRSLEYLSDK
jgi:hypothetical protein